MISTRNAISRAQFLRGDLRGRDLPARPPWAVSEAEFDNVCTNCGECITACPEGILGWGRGRLPVISFFQGECTFCGECVDHCEPGALRGIAGRAPWNFKAFVGDGCLSNKGVMCRSCSDVCEPGAIHFRLAVGGFSHPEFDLDACAGCGACVAPCPARAITVCEIFGGSPAPDPESGIC